MQRQAFLIPVEEDAGAPAHSYWMLSTERNPKFTFSDTSMSSVGTGRRMATASREAWNIVPILQAARFFARMGHHLRTRAQKEGIELRQAFQLLFNTSCLEILVTLNVTWLNAKSQDYPVEVESNNAMANQPAVDHSWTGVWAPQHLVGRPRLITAKRQGDSWHFTSEVL